MAFIPLLQCFRYGYVSLSVFWVWLRPFSDVVSIVEPLFQPFYFQTNGAEICAIFHFLWNHIVFTTERRSNYRKFTEKFDTCTVDRTGEINFLYKFQKYVAYTKIDKNM